MRKQWIDSSIRMLHLLENMVSDSEEPYNGIVWQLLCSPFTPFLALFGEVVSNAKGTSKEREEYLAAMEKFPGFLRKMGLRNSLAKKLGRIALILVQHARSVINSKGMCSDARSGLRSVVTDQHIFAGPRASEAAPGSSIPRGALPDPWPLTGNMLHWDSLSSDDTQPNDLTTETNDFFGDVNFDWIRWDSQV